MAATASAAAAATAGGTVRAAAAAPPPVIRKLDENVVNKIAAGEVIQRPASALKEMLENSLDAGSTQISVTVKEGGNKLLQITDNGSGIRKDDLPILCHRHTTSKLRQYEDLETISTLGFRGEALCSISFVSHMSVTTMARGAQYGYRVTFKDSEMEPPGPRPVAAVPGTTITVEDLFYNVPTRRKALKSATEEYGLILDVVGRYAVYSTGVALTCRRQGDSRPDISTTAAGSRVDAVRSVYGTEVARELLPLCVSAGGGTGPEVPVDGPMGLRVEGLISGANYGSGKKTVLVLFINGRCVECSPLRRCLEGLYGTLLPKAARPWIFLDVRLPPRQVEVNMHPTKREVGFMHQVEVIEEIRRAVESKLLASNECRTFATTATATLQQSQLPFAALPLTAQGQGSGQGSGSQARLGSGGAANEEEGGEEEDDGEEEGGGEEEDGEERRRRRRASAPAGRGLAGGGGGSQDLKRPAAAGAGAAALPYRPEKLVRVDYRAGTLDTFVFTKTNGAGGAGGAGDAARAAAAGGSVARKRSAAARQPSAADGSLRADPQDPQAQPQAQPQSRTGRALPPGLVTAEVLGLGPYAGVPGEVQEDARQGPGEEEGAGGGGGGPAAARAPTRRSLPALVTADPVVLDLWSEVEGGTHAGLGEVLREHTFVGMADGSLALLQHGTRLYLVDVGGLSRDMFYQLALRRWDQPLCLALEPPPLVSELVGLGLQLLQVKGEWRPEDGSPEELGELVSELLQQNRPALERQLGLVVDEQGRLRSVPLLLEGLPPDPARLPDLVVGLAKDVDWDQPRDRARAIAEALAELYAARPPLPPEAEAECATPQGEAAGTSGRDTTGPLPGASGGGAGQKAQQDEQDGQQQQQQQRVGAHAGEPAGARGGEASAAASDPDGEQQQRQQQQDVMEGALAAYEYKIKNVILPAMRGCLKPPRARATDGSCVQVAALERLYRIFERC
ncbi:DNA mismatch repair protein [Pleodorina starrii]|nr:DNA mismatch repair protein [Pleodorina starrii]GLC66277.1 DNA mismatch repair protein [Pleodorina starrii]